VLLLPAHGVGPGLEFQAGAFLVESVEHMYTSVERKGSRPYEARLTKAVAQVKPLSSVSMV